jgi:hypothetical protein
MTLEDMKALLAGRLGQRSDIDQMIYAEIRQAQSTLEKTPPYPWFLETAVQTESDEGNALLPDDFIEMVEDAVYIIKATDDVTYYSPMVKLHGVDQEHASNVTWGTLGRPRYFSISGQALWVIPGPDKSYTFVFRYFQKDDVLSSPSSENLWSTRAEDLLVAEAGWHVARNIRDAEAAAMFGQDRAEARRRIAQETTSRRESMRRAVIGAGEDALLLQPRWEIGHQ